MNESERLAEQIGRALEGGAWHGPSWREVLEGVRREIALHRPVPEAHTIAEIVLHATTWHEIVRRRLLGETPSITAEEDWARPSVPDGDAWSAMRERLLQTGHALRETVAALPPERLHERRPGLDDTWFGLIIGQLQHMLYHAGQIPILRKAAAASR